MHGISKYKVTMVTIVLMFIFVIAAIYSNTKDAAEQKIRLNETPQNQSVSNINIEQNSPINIEQNSPVKDDNVDIKTSDNEDALNAKLFALTERVDNVEKAIFVSKNNSDETGIRCSVKGIIKDEHFVPMESEQAIKESKTSGNEVVLSCVFK